MAIGLATIRLWFYSSTSVEISSSITMINGSQISGRFTGVYVGIVLVLFTASIFWRFSQFFRGVKRYFVSEIKAVQIL